MLLLSLTCLSNPQPLVQIIAMLGILWGGVGILEALFRVWRAFLAEQRRKQEEAIRKEKQETRKNRVATEREERKEQQEKLARALVQNRERMQESQQRQATEIALQNAQREQREIRLEQEAIRLRGLPHAERRTEMEQMLARAPFPASPATATAEGILWELTPRLERTLLFLWQKEMPLSLTSLESLEALRQDRSALRLYLVCFEGYPVEVVEAISDLPIMLIEPHLLAYWLLEGIKI